MGKTTNLDIPKTVQTRSSKPMEKIHMDVFGPCKCASFAGHSYCCVFVDDCTRYCWVYTLKTKGEVFDCVQKLYADTAVIRNQFPMCCLRRDNAGENTSKKLLDWLT